MLRMYSDCRFMKRSDSADKVLEEEPATSISLAKSGQFEFMDLRSALRRSGIHSVVETERQIQFGSQLDAGALSSIRGWGETKESGRFAFSRKGSSMHTQKQEVPHAQKQVRTFSRMRPGRACSRFEKRQVNNHSNVMSKQRQQDIRRVTNSGHSKRDTKMILSPNRCAISFIDEAATDYSKNVGTKRPTLLSSRVGAAPGNNYKSFGTNRLTNIALNSKFITSLHQRSLSTQMQEYHPGGAVVVNPRAIQTLHQQ